MGFGKEIGVSLTTFWSQINDETLLGTPFVSQISVCTNLERWNAISRRYFCIGADDALTAVWRCIGNCVRHTGGSITT